MEENAGRALLMSRGDRMTFVGRPISAVLLVVSLLPNRRKSRGAVFQE